MVAGSQNLRQPKWNSVEQGAQSVLKCFNTHTDCNMYTCAINQMQNSHSTGRGQTARKQNSSRVKMSKGTTQTCLTVIQIFEN